MTEVARAEARASSLERWRAGLLSQIRWLGGSSAVGFGGAWPSLAFDRTGRVGAAIWFLTSLVGVYGSFLSQRAAGRRAMIDAEKEVNFQALQEARRHLAWCEGETADLRMQVGKIEARIDALRDKHEADIKEVIDKFLRRDSPDARPRPDPR